MAVSRCLRPSDRQTQRQADKQTDRKAERHTERRVAAYFHEEQKIKGVFVKITRMFCVPTFPPSTLRLLCATVPATCSCTAAHLDRDTLSS